jgi:hypothetical protein
MHGVRLAAGVDAEDPCVRARAAGLVLPKGGALGSWAAAALLGVPSTWLDGKTSDGRHLPIPVVIPMSTRARARRGLRVGQAPLDPGDVVALDGVPVTCGVRTAFDLIRHAPDLRVAVAAGDACLRYKLTTAEQLAAYGAARRGWRGIALARQAVPLLDGRSESPKEIELRVIWIRSGLGLPVPQAKIGDELAVFVARVDLLDPKAGVVGEYMGAWHRDGRRPWQDTIRGRALEAVGLEVVEFWAHDLVDVRRTAEALGTGYLRAGRRDAAERTYVILR